MRLFRVRQVKGFAVFAAINLCVGAPGLGHITASSLLHIRRVKPALEMAAAELALGILLIARALPQLLDLHLVMGELWDCPRNCGSACSQRRYPRGGPEPPNSPTNTSFYSKRFVGCHWCGAEPSA